MYVYHNKFKYILCPSHIFRALGHTFMVMTSTMKGSGPRTRGVAGAECTTVMGPYTKESGLMTCNTDRAFCCWVCSHMHAHVCVCGGGGVCVHVCVCVHVWEGVFVCTCIYSRGTSIMYLSLQTTNNMRLQRGFHSMVYSTYLLDPSVIASG